MDYDAPGWLPEVAQAARLQHHLSAICQRCDGYGFTVVIELTPPEYRRFRENRGVKVRSAMYVKHVECEGCCGTGKNSNARHR